MIGTAPLASQAIATQYEFNGFSEELSPNPGNELRFTISAPGAWLQEVSTEAINFQFVIDGELVNSGKPIVLRALYEPFILRAVK